MNGANLFTRQLQVLLLASPLLLSSCSPAVSSDILTVVAGRDSRCARATTEKICGAMKGCQAAYEDLASDIDSPIFSACIAAPRQNNETADPDHETADEEVAITDCNGIADEHLYIRHIMETLSDGDKKKIVTKRELKMKVCHETGNMAAHTIITDCRPLKADQYLGACLRPGEL